MIKKGAVFSKKSSFQLTFSRIARLLASHVFDKFPPEINRNSRLDSIKYEQPA